MCIKEVWGIFREKGSRAPIKMQGGNMEQHISVVGLLIWALLRTRTRRLSSQNPSISYLWKQCQSSVVEKKKGNGKRKTNDNNGWLIQSRPLHINRVWTRKEFLQVTQQISSWWVHFFMNINSPLIDKYPLILYHWEHWCVLYKVEQTLWFTGMFLRCEDSFHWSSHFQRAVWWVKVTLGFRLRWVRFTG